MCSRHLVLPSMSVKEEGNRPTRDIGHGSAPTKKYRVETSDAAARGATAGRCSRHEPMFRQ